MLHSDVLRLPNCFAVVFFTEPNYVLHTNHANKMQAVNNILYQVT